MPIHLLRLDLIVTSFCIALLGYIVWNVQQGARGHGYSEKLLSEKSLLTAELKVLSERNFAFEAHVQLLRPESVDPDLVDELARRNLAMALPNDRIIYTTP